MAKRKVTAKAANERLGLHRRQLFHWIGSDLEKDRRLTAAARAEKYVQYLERSLERGLWLKRPREKDEVGTNGEFEVIAPICCFTETTLDEVEFHNRKYGRLGLGFPKRFVLSNGGKPVNYVNDTKDDLTFKAWCLLRSRLYDERIKSVFSEREREELQREFTYLAHFLKRIKDPYANREKIAQVAKKIKKSADKSRGTPEVKVSYKRNYGAILEYLEEREWRIVGKIASNKPLPKALKKNLEDEGPDWYLPYQPARDLFTVVFPDNRTLAGALSNRIIRQKLLTPNQPAVTLLSLEDLGTF